MEKIQQETEFNLSKKQVQSIINLELEKENGLNDPQNWRKRPACDMFCK